LSLVTWATASASCERISHAIIASLCLYYISRLCLLRLGSFNPFEGRPLKLRVESSLYARTLRIVSPSQSFLLAVVVCSEACFWLAQTLSNFDCVHDESLTCFWLAQILSDFKRAHDDSLTCFWLAAIFFDFETCSRSHASRRRL
jgi:hypothetical protein